MIHVRVGASGSCGRSRNRRWVFAVRRGSHVRNHGHEAFPHVGSVALGAFSPRAAVTAIAVAAASFTWFTRFAIVGSHALGLRALVLGGTLISVYAVRRGNGVALHAQRVVGGVTVLAAWSAAGAAPIATALAAFVLPDTGALFALQALAVRACVRLDLVIAF
jgi:hypothetical protein